ncbi:MAG TPA: hypothetical protein VFC19_48740 [Candidatus Limnocylindrales bacterium]|nr:hypothetical protein [Candidatus Limnocylindrales bacterium]
MIRCAALLGRHGIGGPASGALLLPPTPVPSWRSLGIHQPPRPTTVKILVTGGVGCGKTTFIRTISQRPPHTTDVAVTGQPGRHTTAAGETGWLRLSTGPDTGVDTGPGAGLDLHLVGTPGHPRYQFLWPHLASGAQAALILTDPARLTNAYPALDACDRLGLPYVVVITAPTPVSDDDIRQAASLTPGTLVVHCDPQQRASVHDTLTIAVHHLGLLQPTANPSPLTSATIVEHGRRGAVAAPDMEQSPHLGRAP